MLPISQITVASGTRKRRTVIEDVTDHRASMQSRQAIENQRGVKKCYDKHSMSREEVERESGKKERNRST